jgi:hypothetical protein
VKYFRRHTSWMSCPRAPDRRVIKTPDGCLRKCMTSQQRLPIKRGIKRWREKANGCIPSFSIPHPPFVTICPAATSYGSPLNITVTAPKPALSHHEIFSKRFLAFISRVDGWNRLCISLHRHSVWRLPQGFGPFRVEQCLRPLGITGIPFKNFQRVGIQCRVGTNVGTGPQN